ncbi:MAG: hypothetical protein IKO12_05990 [Bacteroidaceae bacterium]|nr:hypothetical protein [Bacteroidaceae bacterium]
MKKLHLVALLGLFAAFCGMVFTSCGDDEADPDNPIVGTWSTSEKESNADFSMTMTTSITFTSDGKYSLSEEGEHKSQDFTERFGSRESGNYTLNGNTLTLTATKFAYKNPESGKWEEEDSSQGEPWSQEIAIDGKTLYIALYENGEQIALKKK